MIFRNKYSREAAFVAILHVIGLLFLGLFRLVEFINLRHLLTGDGSPVATAFVNGLLFDNVMMSHVTILPAAALLLCAAFGYSRRWLHRCAVIWYGVWLAIMFIASAANIPFYSYFLTNINSVVFAWFDQPDTVVGMAVGDSGYIGYVALYFVALAACIALLSTTFRLAGTWVGQAPASSSKPWLRILATALLLLLCVVGIRGTLVFTKRPISPSAAYYCNDPFLCQLGIAPSYSLMKSLSNEMKQGNKRLALMADGDAVKAAREWFGVKTADSTDVLLRHAEAYRPNRQPNVVIILMESMSANFMQRFGNQQHLTPTLDSLALHSLLFTRFYSEGTHTNQGILGTLFSQPALMKRNLMHDARTRNLHGLPSVLKSHGYTTSFFMTHWKDFDNMNAVLVTNDVERIYSRADYPESEVVNNYGVSDLFLYDYAIRKLNGQAREGKPFFATLLSISNHPPYTIPSHYKAKASGDEQKAVEYADWALARFFDMACKQPWYQNTVFVMLGDHGKVVGQPDAEVAQSSHHVPMLIFGPGIDSGEYDGMAKQADVMPTILGLLGISYDNHGFGTDLLSQRRERIFYSTDDCIIARDTAHVYIYQPATAHATYYVTHADGSLREAQPIDANATNMEHYVKAMVQTADFITFKHEFMAE